MPGWRVSRAGLPPCRHGTVGGPEWLGHPLPPGTGSPGGGAVEQGSGPEEPGQRDSGAPGNGDDGVAPDGGAEQQAPQGLDDRGERLVLGEPAHPGRHGGGRHEGAADERQYHHDERQAVGARRVLASSPKATVSQVRARVIRANTPAAAIHSTLFAVGRKPSANAPATTSTPLIRVRMRPPRTGPVRTEVRTMAMVRNRAMMPSVISVDTLTAVISALAQPVSTMMAGAR